LNQHVMQEMAERAYKEAQEYSIQRTLESHSKLYQRLVSENFLTVFLDLEPKPALKKSLNYKTS
jgi:hypothetical protein